MSNLGLIRKARTFRTTARSLSMELRKNQGDEPFFHFSHPHHPLVQLDVPYLFTCTGCKEYGAGKRFTCQYCDFDLHEICASAPPSLHGHPFASINHQLVFQTKAGGFLRSSCDVCGKLFKGFAYRCTTCNFEMHPCCSLLLAEMSFPVHAHPLHMYLSPANQSGSGGGDSSATACRMCRRRRSGCVYHCKACVNYSLHAACAKDMVNGLYRSGIRSPEKPNRLGKAARVASHAFLGFIGGLIEGIGEGIGEALVESIVRGRNHSSIRSR